MGYRNELKLRPHVGVNSHLMEMIGNGRCWHFDAWLIDVEGEFYLLTETRAGGRDVLQRNGYRLVLGAAQPLHYVWPVPEGRRITLQDRDMNVSATARIAARDALNAIHWSHIRPMLQRRPDAFTSTSAQFHYIRAPSLAPLEDAANFFRYRT